jgi:hypothetical protein
MIIAVRIFSEFLKKRLIRKTKATQDVVIKPIEDTNTLTEQKNNNINIMDWSTLKPINTSLIEAVDFPVEHYFPMEYKKTQIVLHHTVSNPDSVIGDIDHWLSNDSRIATCIIVDSKGIAHQCFSSKYWGHHLGIKSTWLQKNGYSDWSTRNIELNRNSIAIEIDNWGGLILGDGTDKVINNKVINTIKGEYYNAYGNIVKNVDVIEYPNGFRGYKYYQKYTKAQIKTVGELILLWHIKYGIPLDYHEEMFDISKEAISGTPAIWCHASFREDKGDCAPQPDLIDMLKELKNIH